MSLIRTLKEVLVYENRYVRVFDDEVSFPDGHEGRYFRYQWRAPHAVAIIPVMGRDIILLEMFRYQNQRLSIEIPKGFGTEGNSPEDDACRELAEETGLRASTLEPLYTFDGEILTHVFVAHVLPGSELSKAEAEPTEAITRFIRLPMASISLETLRALPVDDPLTIAALLALREHNLMTAKSKITPR